MTEILDFSGGIATSVAPYLLPTNEALQSINTLIRFGALTSAPNEKAVADVAYKYFFVFNDKPYHYAQLRSNVVWDNKWYWADGSEVKKMLADGTIRDLGLDRPIDSLVATEGVNTKPHTGTFTYTYTYYDDITGTESAPVELSNAITVVGKDIVLNGFQTLHPTDATHFRLYRIGGYLSQFTMVAQLPLTTTTFIDDIDVTNIDGRLLQTIRTEVPPSGLKYLVEFNGRLYGAVGNRIYFSSLGNPDSWYLDDYFQVTATITALASTPAGLLVFTKYTTNILRGTDPANFYMKELSSNVGCISFFSIAQYQDMVLFLSDSSFNLTNGVTIKDLTSDKIPNLGSMYPLGTTVKNQVYYMSYGSVLVPDALLLPNTLLYPNGTPIGGLDEGIVVINFNVGRGFAYHLLEAEAVGNLGLIQSKIHAGYNKSTVAFKDCSTKLSCNYFLPISATLASLEANEYSTFRTLTYLSPLFIDGSLATLKEYDKVRIIYEGSFTVKVILKGVGEVVSRTFNDKDSKDGFVIIGLPNSSNKGYGIQFHIEGVGVINAIQYSLVPRSIP